jgi:hypothetical protein
MRRFSSLLWLSLVAAMVAPPVIADAQIICVSNVSAPPEIPIYEQPPIPASGYIWIPGYWASGPNGYFWVPGTWTLPPAAGLLWTPGYWAWRDGVYIWNAGYWGPHIGFYGGINYGFGYSGVGYEGGHWENGAFFYNRTVNNLTNVTITNVYEKTVIVDANAPRVSFNGGSGGTTARPTAQEVAAAHEQHVAAIPTQFQHERMASSDRSLLASENRGHPPIAATAKPGDFTKGTVAAREAEPNAKSAPGAMPMPAPANTTVKPKSPPHPTEPAQSMVKPAKPPTPPSATAPTEPTQAAVKPAKPPSPPSAPTQASVKPEKQVPPPPHGTSAPPKPPAPAAHTAAKPEPAPPHPPAAVGGKPPGCPPGKKLVSVNGQQTCK